MKCLKKYLLLFVACFCFLSCKNVFAEELTFTTSDLDSEETYTKIIDYMKSRYNFNSFILTIDYYKENVYFYILNDGYTANIYDFRSIPYIAFSSVDESPVNSSKNDGCVMYNLQVNKTYNYNTDLSQLNGTGSFENQIKYNLIKYSTFDLNHYNGTTIFAKNYEFKKDDNTTDNTPTTDEYYHPTKEEYMLTPFLLALLIIMLFLKWCFPLKGGKRL